MKQVTFDERYSIRVYAPCGCAGCCDYDLTGIQPATIIYWCPVCKLDWTLKLKWRKGRVYKVEA